MEEIAVQADSYRERLEQEIENYKRIFERRMSQPVPSVWLGVEKRLADLVEAATGVRNLYEYVARHVVGRSDVSVLGLGSGACGNELDGIAPLLNRQSCRMELTCVDINETVLAQASEEARKRGVGFCAIVQDINRIILEPKRYDVIVAYASLHHFLDLDHVAEELNRALKPHGIFITVDIPSRNGYMMWDETFAIVTRLWALLPPRFKIAHTGYAELTHVEVRENVDYGTNSFECINSEAIIPALRKHLEEIHYVPAFAIARRFFDTQFGPNYDVAQPLDRAIFEFIMQLDQYYVASELLKPETFFGVYRPGSG